MEILKPHVLLCGLHKNDANNAKLLAQFKEKFIENCRTPLPPLFSRQISCFSDIVGISKIPGQHLNTFNDFLTDSDITESAIFQLQTIEIQGVKLNLCFDSGCGDMIAKKSAVFDRGKQIVSQPIVLSGVGDQKFVCNEGAYTICLPLFSGKNAFLTGLCLPKITTEFPTYDLGSVENEIRKNCKQQNQNLVHRLPKLPRSGVGGDTDILIGSKYNRYFPKPIFKLETGLEIFESFFVSPCGSL